jgi:hypothetical protein
MRSPEPTNPKLAHPRASNLTLKQNKRPKKKPGTGEKGREKNTPETRRETTTLKNK